MQARNFLLLLSENGVRENVAERGNKQPSHHALQPTRVIVQPRAITVAFSVGDVSRERRRVRVDARHETLIILERDRGRDALQILQQPLDSCYAVFVSRTTRER